MMAHLKLEILFIDPSYEPIKPKRIQAYVINSLKELKNEANTIKCNTVVMCSSAYAFSSTNEGEWIQGSIADYKEELDKSNIQPLSNNYIEFIRYGQHYMEKNGEGNLALITNNSFD
ncbi:hypothetical protein [Psychrobacter sp. ASPA161_9]|uniref:hypothetical protein n=1 Tax=Psychrobacter sp. ASPA161_9 TaxID=3160961 RepID=UPI003F7D9FE3